MTRLDDARRRREEREARGDYDVMGSAEVAAALGIHVANIDRHPGMPEPVARIRATRLWHAADIADYRASRESR